MSETPENELRGPVVVNEIVGGPGTIISGGFAHEVEASLVGQSILEVSPEEVSTDVETSEPSEIEISDEDSGSYQPEPVAEPTEEPAAAPAPVEGTILHSHEPRKIDITIGGMRIKNPA
jgi:hypothetical protein